MNAVPRLPKQDLHRNRVLQHRDPLLPRQRRQSQLDVRTRRVAARVQHARLRVCALPRQRDLALARIERHAQPHEVLNPSRRFAGQHARRLFVHEPRAGLDRVPQVLFRRVAGPDWRRYPALRPARVAVVDAALRQHEHAAVLTGEESSIQPCNA